MPLAEWLRKSSCSCSWGSPTCRADDLTAESVVVLVYGDAGEKEEWVMKMKTVQVGVLVLRKYKYSGQMFYSQTQPSSRGAAYSALVLSLQNEWTYLLIAHEPNVGPLNLNSERNLSHLSLASHLRNYLKSCDTCFLFSVNHAGLAIRF